MFDFAQQVAVVTGASGALGGVVAQRLHDAGARLILPARDPDRLRTRFAVSDRIIVLPCEITDAESVAAFARAVAENHGGAQLLVNVAGGFRGAPLAETSTEIWDEMIAANARSTFLLCRALLPGMLERGERVSSAIVNIGSRAAERGGAGVAAYSAAKAAVLRITESLAAEIAGSGLRANCVLPSTIDTPANRAAMPDADRSTWVQPEAVADVILFLLSPLSRALNGAALPV